MPGNLVDGTISITALLGVTFAVVFLFLLLIVAVLIYLRGKPVPPAALLIFRTILTLSAGAFGWVVGGTIALSFNLGVVTGNAAGGIALAALAYLVNPPLLLEDRIIDKGAPSEPPPRPAGVLRERRPDGDAEQ